ncbi:hypothetical protein MHYP_G00141900 [Metynnis hypsauchen]
MDDHGSHHFRALDRLFWRTVRGVLPHKARRILAALEMLKMFSAVPRLLPTTMRDQATLERLVVFDGIPPN